jgi:hypothetical protein
VVSVATRSTPRWGIAMQALSRLWNTAIDQAPQYTQNGALLIYYGSR